MITRNRLRPAVSAAVVAATAGGLLTATATASAAVTCASPVYKRQFFANTTLSGTPKKTDCDSAIDQSWGAGAPTSGLPSNNFSVRWSVTRDFGSGGPFTLAAETQDGIRVYLDGTRKIDLWKNVSSTQKKSLNLTIPSGIHTLRVDYVNWTGSANVTFAYAPRTSATVDTVKPLAPTGPSVTYDATTGKATVKWAKNKEMDLAGYRVHRRLKGTSFGSKPLSTTTSTSYTDAALPKTGATYYYEVRAYDKAGRESSGTADQLVTTVDKTPPAAPFVEMDSCPDNEKVAGPELVTTAENGADIALYQAQRLNPATGDWITVHSGPKGAFCDTGRATDGTKATYRGRARDAAGNWSAYSAAATFTLSDRIPPPAPADVRVDYRSGVPHLVWTPDADAASYQVLQYDPATGAYLKGFGDNDTTTKTDVVPLQQLALADEYRYAVRAVDAKGNASAPAEVTLPMTERPEATSPYLLTAQARSDGVSLSWRSADPWAFDDDNIPAYQIVRTDPATGESATVEQCSPYDSDGPRVPPTSYPPGVLDAADPAHAGRTQVIYSYCLESSGASETTYEYRIVAVDRYGHRSRPSEPVTATTRDTQRPAPVLGLTAETVPLGVRLTWTPPADDDVMGYYVWQSTTDPDTGRTVWQKNCWTGSSLAETEILCPTLPDGGDHVYRVAATDAQYSDEDPDFFQTAEITVTLPDTRPPGWSGTTVFEGQYPSVYLGCSASSGLDCSRLTGYRVERWDPTTSSYTTLTTGEFGSATRYLDTTVYEDRRGLYYYRVVFVDSSGTELEGPTAAFGIWDSWL
ncbi:PA14 domain-containing protein [Streptomyces sp. NPDC058391]|uniref:PA14 domain-containing protein n=1 Tax=Streptomyces sp. NPDC058391 TaxID=3346476 RepID=UPI003647E2DA